MSEIYSLWVCVKLLKAYRVLLHHSFDLRRRGTVRLNTLGGVARSHDTDIHFSVVGVARSLHT